MNFLALSTCVIDFYPQLNTSFLGGNSLNLASMWKRMGQNDQVSVIACLGNDENGGRIKTFLENASINISRLYQRDGITSNNHLRVDENGERFGIDGTWNGGLYETFLLDESDWNFVEKQNVIAITGHNPNYSELIKRKNDKQLLVVDFLDIENNVPIEETIKYTNIALITANKDLLPKYKELAFRTNKLLIVTLGAEGSYCFVNKKEYHQPAIEVDKVVDTTGCGDAYLAAFSYTYAMSNGIQDSMLAGAEAAADILRFYGGVGNAEVIT